MRWQSGGKESRNIEDRRRLGPKVAAGGAGGLLLVVVLTLLGGGDLGGLLGGLLGGGSPLAPGTGGSPPITAEEREQESVVRKVLGSTEEVWGELFRQSGKTYKEPRLVLFHGSVQSACGMASSAVGPFYCPPDQHVYIDLSFFSDLARRYRAPGDFAQAYVVAHEVGHHVQNLLGIAGKVRDLEKRARSEAEKNQYSVRLELQADYLAGVWAHHARRMSGLVLEPGDLEEAIRCAEAIGDDALQKQAQGYAVPDSFTHGSSAQRMAWFQAGFQSGDLSAMDTFDPATWNRINPR